MTDTRGRIDGYRMRVFPAADIEPDDLIHYEGERYFVLDVHRHGDYMIINTSDGTVDIPHDEEVSVFA